jgi:hypothetical protein
MTSILPQDAKVMPMQQQQVADHPMLMKYASSGWCSPYAQEAGICQFMDAGISQHTDRIAESLEGS